MHPHPAKKRGRALLPSSRLARGVLATALILASLGPGSAAAAQLEGVWTFTGGRIAIQGDGNGTFTGTVVAPTKFAECAHPVGEEVWTEMHPQADGSYWGLHQWYFNNAECVPNPALGLTAWRVLSSPSGSHFLRVCFSEPGSSSQPTIAPDGGVSGATFGCRDSARVSSLPQVTAANARRYLALPANDGCYSRTKLRLRIHDPKGDPFAKIVAVLTAGTASRQAKLKRHGARVIAVFNLKGLGGDSFRVIVHLKTVLGHRLVVKRTYHRCRTTPRHRHHG